MTLRRNTLFSLGGQVVALAISLAAVPPFLHLIGEARYGVLLVVWVLLGYFSLFDLGVGQATSQRVALLRGGTDADRQRVVWTALRMNAALGLVGSGALYVVGRVVLGHVVTMDAQLRIESLGALPWIALALPVSMVASVLSGALQGREAFRATTTVSTISQAISQGFPLYVAWRYSTSLAWLIPAALLARVVTALLTLGLCRSIVPLRGAPRFDRASARSLLGYGGWITVSAIVGPLMTSLDRLVIGSISGSEAVTYYGVPHSLASRLLVLPGSLSGVLMPRLAGQEPAAQAALAEKSIRAVASVLTPAVVVGISIVGPFLRIWIGAEFAAKASAAAQVLFAGVWFNGMAMIAHSSLLARGRPDLIAKMHVLELPCYLGVLALALHLWGVTGAAVAWSLRVMVDALLLYGMAGLLTRSIRHLYGAVGLLVAAWVAARLHGPASIVGWSASTLLAIATCIWSYRNLPPSLVPFGRP